MTEKTYTAAEVEKLLAEQKARLAELQGNKPVNIFVKSGTFKPTAGKNKGQEIQFKHISINGPFFPAKLSIKAAKAVIDHPELLKAAYDAALAEPTAEVESDEADA